MPIRRVVTAVDGQGKSVFVSDGIAPQAVALTHTPGFVSAPLWKSETAPDLGQDAGDTMAELTNLIPAPGGATFMVVTFPPDAVFGSEGFDFEKAGAEHAVLSPGLAETFEPDNPGMHRTPTVDYVAVLSGRVVLELDDGATVTLGPGDTVVQQGTRHAWRNPFDEPVSLAVVLTGAHGANGG